MSNNMVERASPVEMAEGDGRGDGVKSLLVTFIEPQFIRVPKVKMRPQLSCVHARSECQESRSVRFPPSSIQDVKLLRKDNRRRYDYSATQSIGCSRVLYRSVMALSRRWNFSLDCHNDAFTRVCGQGLAVWVTE
jgi:hypothetical protein